MPTKKVTTPSTTPKKTSATKKTASPKKAVETVAAVKTPAEQKAAATPVAPASGKKTAEAAAAKSATAEKTAAKKKATPVHLTTVIARVDVGYGNTLFIRGEGAGLSWTAGVLMETTAGDEWSWSTPAATEALTFKFLINDEIWSAGDNLTVAAGETSVSTPTF